MKEKSSRDLPSSNEGRWLAASDLRIGDVVRLKDGSEGVVQSITRQEERKVVYNFHVAEAHNYAVGGQGILVHNVSEAPSDEVVAQVVGRAIEGYAIERASKESGRVKILLRDYVEGQDLNAMQLTEVLEGIALRLNGFEDKKSQSKDYRKIVSLVGVSLEGVDLGFQSEALRRIGMNSTLFEGMSLEGVHGLNQANWANVDSLSGNRLINQALNGLDLRHIDLADANFKLASLRNVLLNNSFLDSGNLLNISNLRGSFIEINQDKLYELSETGSYEEALFSIKTSIAEKGTNPKIADHVGLLVTGENADENVFVTRSGKVVKLNDIETTDRIKIYKTNHPEIDSLVSSFLQVHLAAEKSSVSTARVPAIDLLEHFNAYPSINIADSLPLVFEALSINLELRGFLSKEGISLKDVPLTNVNLDYEGGDLFAGANLLGAIDLDGAKFDRNTEVNLSYSKIGDHSITEKISNKDWRNLNLEGASFNRVRFESTELPFSFLKVEKFQRMRGFGGSVLNITESQQAQLSELLDEAIAHSRKAVKVDLDKVDRSNPLDLVRAILQIKGISGDVASKLVLRVTNTETNQAFIHAPSGEVIPESNIRVPTDSRFTEIVNEIVEAFLAIKNNRIRNLPRVEINQFLSDNFDYANNLVGLLMEVKTALLREGHGLWDSVSLKEIPFTDVRLNEDGGKFFENANFVDVDDLGHAYFDSSVSLKNSRITFQDLKDVDMSDIDLSEVYFHSVEFPVSFFKAGSLQRIQSLQKSKIQLKADDLLDLKRQLTAIDPGLAEGIKKGKQESEYSYLIRIATALLEARGISEEVTAQVTFTINDDGVNLPAANYETAVLMAIAERIITEFTELNRGKVSLGKYLPDLNHPNKDLPRLLVYLELLAREADLPGWNHVANLTGVSLEEVDLGHRDFRLDELGLNGKIFEGVNLSRYTSGTGVRNLNHASFLGASLEGSNINGQSLSFVNLKDTNLKDVSVSSTSIRYSDLPYSFFDTKGLETVKSLRGSVLHLTTDQWRALNERLSSEFGVEKGFSLDENPLELVQAYLDEVGLNPLVVSQISLQVTNDSGNFVGYYLPNGRAFKESNPGLTGDETLDAIIREIDDAWMENLKKSKSVSIKRLVISDYISEKELDREELSQLIESLKIREETMGFAAWQGIDLNGLDLSLLSFSGADLGGASFVNLELPFEVLEASSFEGVASARDASIIIKHHNTSQINNNIRRAYAGPDAESLTEKYGSLEVFLGYADVATKVKVLLDLKGASKKIISQVNIKFESERVSEILDATRAQFEIAKNTESSIRLIDILNQEGDLSLINEVLLNLNERADFELRKRLDFDGISLDRFSLAHFWGVNLSEVEGVKYALFSNSDLRGVSLVDTDFETPEGKNFENINFQGANLTDSNFNDVSFKKSKFVRTNLMGTSLYGSDLAGANVINALLSTSFLGAELKNLSVFSNSAIVVEGEDGISDLNGFLNELERNAPQEGQEIRKQVGSMDTWGSEELTVIARAVFADKLKSSDKGINPEELSVVLLKQGEQVDTQKVKSALNAFLLKRPVIPGKRFEIQSHIEQFELNTEEVMQLIKLAKLLVPNSRKISVTGVDFTGFDVGSIFSGMNLIGALNLKDANFIGADLTDTSFFQSDLTNVNFEDAILRRTRMDTIDLTGADFSKTSVIEEAKGANLVVRATKVGNLLKNISKMYESSKLFRESVANADFLGADLSGVDFVNRKLNGIDLSKANLEGTFLGGVALRHATVGLNLFDAYSIRGIRSFSGAKLIIDVERVEEQLDALKVRFPSQLRNDILENANVEVQEKYQQFVESLLIERGVDPSVVPDIEVILENPAPLP